MGHASRRDGVAVTSFGNTRRVKVELKADLNGRLRRL